MNCALLVNFRGISPLLFENECKECAGMTFTFIIRSYVSQVVTYNINNVSCVHVQSAAFMPRFG